MSKQQPSDATPGHGVDGLAITPLKGHLVSLKTKGEIRASHDLIDVYIVELPARFANTVLTHLRRTLPQDPNQPDLQHLRRVIQPSFLPPTVLSSLSPPLTSTSETRLLLICPTSLIPLPALTALLAPIPPFTSVDNSDPFPLTIHTLPTPSHPPTSAPLAALWSTTHWPTTYKHTNPSGPHPAAVARAAAEISPLAPTWLGLAARAGTEAIASGCGVGVGCVVVERPLDGNGRGMGEGRVVAVAGDGRWCGGVEREGAGNVMAHAVMRAVGMVGVKRVELEEAEKRKETETETEEGQQAEEADGKPSRACADPVESVFATAPATEVEKAAFAAGKLAPGGYLCTDLEIYLTHEPCVMCAMAIVHSRFNRCVFVRRMDRSGAMTADERGVGHGLFWRPAELNWKFLCWEFVEEEGNSEAEGRERVPVVDEGINA